MNTLRRRSLAGAAGLLMVGLAGSSKAAELDGELLHLVGEFVAHITADRAALNTMTQEQQRVTNRARVVDPMRGIVSQTTAMAEAIARIPARTPEGVQAKARALLWYHGGSDAGLPYPAIGDGLFESLLADMTDTPVRFRPLSRSAVPGGAT